MTPETDGTAEAALRKARATLESSLGQVDAHFGNLVSRIDTVLETATFVSPGAALLFSRRVSSSLAELGARIREAVTEIRRILDSSTPIFSLIHVGTSWNMQVLPRLSALVGVARDIRANALHAWGGEASRAYQEKRWGQRDGLQGLTNVVKDTSQWLVDVAVLNTTFLTDITNLSTSSPRTSSRQPWRSPRCSASSRPSTRWQGQQPGLWTRSLRQRRLSRRQVATGGQPVGRC